MLILLVPPQHHGRIVIGKNSACVYSSYLLSLMEESSWVRTVLVLLFLIALYGSGRIIIGKEALLLFFIIVVHVHW